MTEQPARLGSARQLSERVAAYLREAINGRRAAASEFVRMEHVAARRGVSARPCARR